MPGAKTQKAKETRPAGSVARRTASGNAAAAGSRKVYVAAAVAIVFIILLGGFIISEMNVPGGQQPATAQLSAFLGNFASSPRAGILVTYYNGSTFGASVTCATGLIEQLISSPATHRNTTTLDFFIVNQTSCVYSPSGLGSAGKNYTYTTPSNCIASASGEPTIYINYNSTNATVATPAALYVHGTMGYLERCGIASEINTVK